MAEKWVTPCKDIHLNDPDTEEPLYERTQVKDSDTGEVTETKNPVIAKWRAFSLRALNHPRMTGGGNAIRAANLLRRKIKKAEESVPFSVPAEDLTLFVSVLNDPDNLDGKRDGGDSRGVGILGSLTHYRPDVMPQLQDFIDSWTEAPGKEPEKKKEHPAEAPAAEVVPVVSPKAARHRPLKAFPSG